MAYCRTADGDGDAVKIHYEDLELSQPENGGSGRRAGFLSEGQRLGTRRLDEHAGGDAPDLFRGGGARAQAQPGA